MDNKKWYKRISTCFWFLLATAPVWYLLLASLFAFFSHTDGLTTLSDLYDYHIKFFLLNIFNNNVSQFFQSLIPPFIKNMFISLFQQLGISSGSSLVLSIIFGWFTWTYFIELICDFMVWLPRFFHNILNKGVDKID